MTHDHFRFVAHIDILGMSSIVDRDADAAWKVLSDLVEVRDRAGNYELEFLDTNEHVSIAQTIKKVTFSDTIVLFTKGDTDTELRCMIILAAELLHKAMCSCVPVRIGLSYGRFYFNIEKSMYAGPALIEAYRIGESAQWIGIALASSIEERAMHLEMRTGNSKVVVSWTLPVKNQNKKCLVVNWPAVVAHDFTVTPPISIKQFYQGFENTFGAFSHLPPDVQAKYENTVEFINEQLRSHRAT